MQKNETYKHVPTGHIVEITDATGSWIHYKNLTLGTENSKPKYVFKQFYKRLKE